MVFWVVLAGLILLAALWVGVIGFMSGVLPTLARGAPYVPAHPELVNVMLELAQIRPTDYVMDLGSGDGRLVFAAAEAGAKQALGYEIDPLKVHAAAREAKRRGLSNAVFVAGSFWNPPWHEADVMFVYALPMYVAAIAKKCRAEVKPGARIISLLYALPGYTPIEQVNGVILYQQPSPETL